MAKTRTGRGARAPSVRVDVGRYRPRSGLLPSATGSNPNRGAAAVRWRKTEPLRTATPGITNARSIALRPGPGPDFLPAGGLTSVKAPPPRGDLSGYFPVAGAPGAWYGQSQSIETTPLVTLHMNPRCSGPRFALGACLFLLLVPDRGRADPGDVDPAFVSGAANLGGGVSLVALQEDGRLVVAGSFTNYNGAPARNLVRLRPDGSVDPEFSVGSGFEGMTVGTFVAPAQISVILPTAAGLLVGGTFEKVNGQPKTNLVRLLASGAVDPGFAPGVDGAVAALAVLPTGKILVGGGFRNVGGVARSGFARLEADGQLDTGWVPNWGTFLGASARAIVVQPDGRILVGGTHLIFAGGLAVRGVARLTAEGALDPSFQPPALQFQTESVGAMAVQADGKILIAGLFQKINGQDHKAIARLNADGTLDPTWPGSGANAGGLGAVNAVVAGPNQQFYVGGGFETLNGLGPGGIARLNADGSRDPAFRKPAGSSTFAVQSLAVQADGHVVVAGTFTLGTSSDSFRTVLRLLGSGSATVPPPAITTQPQGVAFDLNATDQSLGVIASGTPPLSYQWHKDGEVLQFQSEPTLRFSQVFESTAGDYQVVVTNPGGSVTSLVATVRVNLPARVTSQPASRSVAVGERVTFSVGVSGTAPVRFQWRKGPDDLPGATNATFTLDAAQPGDAGRYSVVVANALGSETSQEALLQVTIAPPEISAHPLSQTVTLAETNLTARTLASRRLRLTVLGGLAPWIDHGIYEITFTESAYYSPAGGALPTASTGGYAVGQGTAPPATLLDFTTFFPAGNAARLTLVPNGIFEFNRADLVEDQNGRWELIPPFVPFSGPTVTLTVTATGVPPLTYQWFHDGMPLTGQSGATLTLTNVQLSDLGEYSVEVGNLGGKVRSDVALVSTGGLALAAPKVDGGKLHFNLPTSPGKTYGIQFQSALGGNWSTLQTVPGDGSARPVSVPAAGATGFVRVEER